LPFDPRAARAELAAAGVATPLRLSVLAAAEQPLHRRILEAAHGPFAAAGIELVAETVEFGTLVQRLQARDFDGALALELHDPWIDPWPHFHSSQGGPGGQNWMGFADPEVDRILDAARFERDPQARNALYGTFTARMRELQPVTLLVHPRVAVLLHRRFQGVEVGPLGLVPETWWVRPEDVLHR
jgi:peptide/nickel transport system substrate-binding protein